MSIIDTVQTIQKDLRTYLKDGVMYPSKVASDEVMLNKDFVLAVPPAQIATLESFSKQDVSNIKLAYLDYRKAQRRIQFSDLKFFKYHLKQANQNLEIVVKRFSA